MSMESIQVGHLMAILNYKLVSLQSVYLINRPKNVSTFTITRQRAGNMYQEQY